MSKHILSSFSAALILIACQTQPTTPSHASDLTHVPQPRISVARFGKTLGVLPTDGVLFDLELPFNASKSISSVKISSTEMALDQWHHRPLVKRECAGAICRHFEWLTVRSMQDQGTINVTWYDSQNEALGEKTIKFTLGGGGFVDSRPAWHELNVQGPKFELGSEPLRLMAGQYLATAIVWYPAEDAPADLMADFGWQDMTVPNVLEAKNCRLVGNQRECAHLRLDGPVPVSVGQIEVRYGSGLKRTRAVTSQ